ncbi:MAG TPA: alpha/beta hydrolase fold domain-containing protein [Candidatus Eremiobacteraceae bacterium]|nr:alpha/beta hydrolase fold domain-containing protein [Candidatus Eremiobacteraceae bacterium]
MNRRTRPGRVAGATVVAFAAAAALAASAPPAPSAIPGPAASVPSDGGASLRGDIDAARTHLIAGYRSIDARSGLADVLESRIDVDESNLFDASRPATETPAQFWDRNAALVALDRSLVDQLSSGKAHALADVRGLDDIPLPTATGGMLAPCAIDVPSSYATGKPMPLVVLLHPQSTSESTELAEPLFRSLAESSGAIVIAPYARGDDMRSPKAADDVYAALAAVEGAFTIDRRHVYLVGDSLGGVAAFEVALWRPDQWSALLAIRSTLDPADTTRASNALSGKTIYIVAGTADGSVPIDVVRRSITWFHDVGIAPMYYEVPNATHDLGSLAVAIRLAWNDMFAGKRAVEATPFPIPTPTPPPSGHP